jgi:hypothetical protein
LPEGLDVVREQQGVTPGAGCSQRSLRPGVPATNHDHVEFVREVHTPAAVPKRRDFTLFSFEP